MTLFEYVTVAVSIVLSFGIVRLLDGLRPALSANRRYWVHALWIITKLFNHALYWWALWSTREIAPWNFATFLWVLLFPGTLYLQSTVLVTTTPGQVASWREHFYEVRVWFFWANLFLVLQTQISLSVLLNVPLLQLSRFPFLLVLILNVAGLSSTNPRLHGAIATLTLLAQLIGFGALFFSPGGSSA